MAESLSPVLSCGHGPGSGNEEINKDEGRCLRVVNRTILEYHCRPSRVPLLLAALPEHHGLFGASVIILCFRLREYDANRWRG